MPAFRQIFVCATPGEGRCGAKGGEELFEAFREEVERLGMSSSTVLRNACTRSWLPVEIEVQLAERPPPDVEATVYFCCLEAVNNAAKHAGEGATITLTVRGEGASLVFAVADNGIGFDVDHAVTGQGFDNMRDRLGAHGGELVVESTAGGGTCVRGRMPIPIPEMSEPADVAPVSELA